jgi:hypothetical protein
VLGIFDEEDRDCIAPVDTRINERFANCHNFIFFILPIFNEFMSFFLLFFFQRCVSRSGVRLSILKVELIFFRGIKYDFFNINIYIFFISKYI